MVVQTMPPRQIRRRINARTCRDPRARAELLASIRQDGIKVPIFVMRVDGGYEIIDGEGRWDIALELDFAEVPVVIFDYIPDEAEILLTQLTINCHRSDLDPVDQADAFAAVMKGKGWTATQLAGRHGKSKTAVSHLMTLASETEEVRQLVRDGKLAVSAVPKLKEMDAEKRAQLIEKAKVGRVTREAIHRAAARQKKSGRGASGKLQRLVCPLRSSTLTFVANAGITYDLVIGEAEDFIKQAKKAREQQLAITTFASTLRDRSKAHHNRSEDQTHE